MSEPLLLPCRYATGLARLPEVENVDRVAENGFRLDLAKPSEPFGADVKAKKIIRTNGHDARIPLS